MKELFVIMALSPLLSERIEITMQDLNDERPGPMLGGQTAREVFIQQQKSLPDRRLLRFEVDSLQAEIKAQAGSRKEVENARRNAIIAYFHVTI